MTDRKSTQDLRKDRKTLVGRLLGYWYVCLSLAFVMLGLRNLLVGAPAWTVALRWMIAAGFLVLGWSSLRFGKQRQ